MGPMTVAAVWAAWSGAAHAADGPKWTYVTWDLDEKALLAVEGVEQSSDRLLSDWFDKYLAAHDATKPEVRIWVTWEDAAGKLHDEGVVTDTPLTVTVPSSAYVALWASANESNGGALDGLTMSGGFSAGCADSLVGTHTSGLVAPAGSFDPDPTDANFYDWLLNVFGIQAPIVSCSAPMVFTGGELSMQATATNHAGLSSTTAPVTLVFTP